MITFVFGENNIQYWIYMNDPETSFYLHVKDFLRRSFGKKIFWHSFLSEVLTSKKKPGDSFRSF